MESTSLTSKKKSLSEKETPTKLRTSVKGEAKQKIEDIQSQTASSEADTKANNPFTVVAIGASAGGLEAITQLFTYS